MSLANGLKTQMQQEMKSLKINKLKNRIKICNEQLIS